MKPTVLLSLLCLFVSVLAQPLEVATTSPEALGIRAEAVSALIDALEAEVDAVHSLVLLRHGKLAAEGWWAPYQAEAPHMLYSLSKSFTATAIGLLSDEKRLSLDDKVLSFFPDQVPEAPSENLRAMRVRDLLCMGSGHHNDTLPPMRESTTGSWIKMFLSQAVEHEPGTHFRYNTGATYMLSAIVQKVSGETLLDYLGPRLFEPLGITEPSWEMSSEGIHTGGYGLKVRTRDIASLGQLYLQKGLWNGKQLLSKEWVAEATSKQIHNGDNPNSDWNQGYGFQFWRCRHNAYRGDGAFGQYCIVLPEQDAVLAITSGLGNMQKVLDLVWTHLLPGFADEALPPSPAAADALATRCARLRLKGVDASVDAPGDAGILTASYIMADNELELKTMSLSQQADGTMRLRIDNAHGEQEISIGKGQAWQAGTLNVDPQEHRTVNEANGVQPVAAVGGWVTPKRYVAIIHFTETPFRLTLTCQFKDDELFLKVDRNVSFGGKRAFQLNGKRAVAR